MTNKRGPEKSERRLLRKHCYVVYTLIHCIRQFILVGPFYFARVKVCNPVLSSRHIKDVPELVCMKVPFPLSDLHLGQL